MSGIGIQWSNRVAVSACLASHVAAMRRMSQIRISAVQARSMKMMVSEYHLETLVP
ncbi:hypothetical protein AB0K12_16970 [Nonomuraea sp. NPDC049419]|uniref:hypothetical protein n=1 Tax=Nonomuraea sp. NPDC049419 TaxID=3155772 RepID=UPI003433F1FD